LDAGGNTVVTPAFMDDDTIAVAITFMVPPAIVMAAVLLDHDGFRTGGIARHRQSDTDGSDRSKCQDNLTHGSSPLELTSQHQRASKGARSNFVWIFKAEGLFI
jgi:hypothetical protein